MSEIFGEQIMLCEKKRQNHNNCNLLCAKLHICCQRCHQQACSLQSSAADYNSISTSKHHQCIVFFYNICRLTREHCAKV